MFNTYVQSIFEQLVKEFDLDRNICRILIINRLEFINEMYKCRYYKYCETDEDLINEINYDNGFFDGSKIFNFYDDENGKIVHRIFVNSEWLPELENKPFDEVIEYLTQSLRHEIGHVLYDNYVFDKLGLEEGNKALNYTTDRGLSAYIKFYNEQMNKYYEDEEMSVEDIQKALISRYYSMKAERLANKFGKVNTRKLFKLTAKFRPLYL